MKATRTLGLAAVALATLFVDKESVVGQSVTITGLVVGGDTIVGANCVSLNCKYYHPMPLPNLGDEPPLYACVSTSDDQRIKQCQSMVNTPLTSTCSTVSSPPVGENCTGEWYISFRSGLVWGYIPTGEDCSKIYSKCQ
jgi:hypothetical protein